MDTGEDMAGDTARELTTARALDALPAGEWRAIRGEGWTGRRLADIEYVVVGPPGVFVVGSVDCPPDLAPGASTPADLVREAAVARVADSAIAVAELLPGLDPHLVTPVLCFVRGEPRPGWARDVRVCTTANLVQLLTTQESVLEPADVEGLFDRLQRALPSAMSWAGSSSGATLNAAGGSPRTRSRKERRASVKHLPWEPGAEVSPGIRVAIIGLGVAVVLCALLQVFLWPLVYRLGSFLAALG